MGVRVGRKEVTVSVVLIINDSNVVIQAGLTGVGHGLAFDDQVADHIAKHRLIRALEHWSPPFPGFIMFYPNHSISRRCCRH